MIEDQSTLIVVDRVYMQRKKGVHYCNQRTDACTMHIHVTMNSMF